MIRLSSSTLHIRNPYLSRLLLLHNLLPRFRLLLHPRLCSLALSLHLVLVAQLVLLDVSYSPQGPVPADGLEQRVQSPSDTVNIR